MDSERGSQSVNKTGGSSLAVEVFYRPFHSDFGHDCVSWSDDNAAIGNDVEFKNIGNSQVPVFTTVSSFDWRIVLDSVAPLVHLNVLAVDLHLVGDSLWVSDAHDCSDSISISPQLEQLFFWRCAGVRKVVNTTLEGIYD